MADRRDRTKGNVCYSKGITRNKSRHEQRGSKGKKTRTSRVRQEERLRGEEGEKKYQKFDVVLIKYEKPTQKGRRPT